MLTPKPGWMARTASLCALLAAAMPAQPPLTTIQDVLYKADGTPFNGYVEITWTSFEASDTSNIATQFRAVRIVNGNFVVRLVPTTNATPAATYNVVYNSDGKVQFQESWAVPPSSKPLRIRDVRISSPSGVSSGGSATQESDIVGLVADLNSRPIEGPGYATGRVLVSNAIGQLEAVSGNLSDCVRVDGSSGACGSATSVPGYTDAETPGGVVDGSNAAFTLAGAPNPAASLALYRNGMLQKAGFDFTLTGSSILFVTAAMPQPGDTLLASYRVAGTSSGLNAADTAPTVETLCSAAGTNTLSTASTSLGTCVIPAGTLQAGNRVEIRFDLAHTGSQSGFTFQMTWGAATLLRQTAASADSLIAGRAEAAIGASGTQLSGQSWGTVLPLAAVVGVSNDNLTMPITVSVSGNLSQPAGDSLTLTNLTVLRAWR